VFGKTGYNPQSWNIAMSFDGEHLTMPHVVNIRAVHYESNREFIEKVKATTDLGKRKLTKYSRDTIVKFIRTDVTVNYVSLNEINEPVLKPVHLNTIYLKDDPTDYEKGDNLASAPEY
jgi:hypothetical protein